jgi:CheY-like chemotaxis protein
VKASASPRSAVIMIVEDDSAIRLLCKVTLERAGRDRGLRARVVEAADLSSARRLLSTDDHGPRPSPRVIIASASVLPTERAEALGAGADRFLAKPYRPSDLVDAVLDLVGEPSAPRSRSNSPSMTR